jgi:coenzyme PQQ synthesis protein D (PqqD)
MGTNSAFSTQKRSINSPPPRVLDGGFGGGFGVPLRPTDGLCIAVVPATTAWRVVNLAEVYRLNDAPTSGPMIEVEARGELLSQEIDGEMVLLDLRSGMYLGLNRLGTFIWKLIDTAHGAVAAETIVQAVTGQFDVDPGRARQDLDQLLVELSSNRLVRVQA